jgi:hypothetical protein
MPTVPASIGRPAAACSGGFLQYFRKPFGHIKHDVVAARDLAGAPPLLPRAGQAGIEIGDRDASRQCAGTRR